MQFIRTLLLAMFTVVAACSSEHVEEEYLDLQECFDDHTVNEGLGVEEAIVICTLEHTYVGQDLDFATVDECIAFVGDNLGVDDASDAEILAACEDYITQKGL